MINTHLAFKKLTAGGMSQELAEIVAELINSSNDNLATKSDLAVVKSELKQDISDLRTELKQDISDLRTELKQDISDLRTELKQDIHILDTKITQVDTKITEAKYDILKWIIPFLATNTLGIVGLAVAFFKSNIWF